jgi:hypothetical protein
MRPDGAPSDRRRDHSRFRIIAGLLGTAVVIAVGAVIGWWQTRPPADDPGPDDPRRRSSRPW